MKIFLVTFSLCLADAISVNNKMGETVNFKKQQEKSETKLKSHHQVMICFDGDNFNGERFKTTDYIPDLKTTSFDKTISSCNVTGIWIFYDGVNYSGSVTLWAFGYNFIKKIPEVFNNKAKSLRFVGAPDDWKASSLNLYSHENFTREEVFTYDDIPELKIEARSVIVTGCQPWTVYHESNYQGHSACIYPSDVKKCTPGLYPTPDRVEEFGTISSARRGCHIGAGPPIKTNLGDIWRDSADGAYGLLCPECNSSSFQKRQ